MWEGVGGFGRAWEGVEGCDRVWKGVEGRGGGWEGLGGGDERGPVALEEAVGDGGDHVVQPRAQPPARHDRRHHLQGYLAHKKHLPRRILQ